MDNLQGLVGDVKITEGGYVRTGRRPRHASDDAEQRSDHGGCGQGVRHEGLRMGLSGHAHHTARGSETTLGDRWTGPPVTAGSG